MKEIKVGKILRPHGIKGEILIQINRENPEGFLGLPYIIIEDETDVFEIESFRSHKKNYIMKLVGITHINQVENWRGRAVYADEWPEEALAEDEYYVEDLIGMKVIDERGRAIGRLVSVMETPANEIYLVDGPFGQVMIPAVGEFILDVSISSGEIHVHLVEGMIDEN